MPYIPKSQGKSLQVDTPDSMSFEITQALEVLQKHIGNVDEYVRSALDYRSMEDLFKALSAEQIDVVALNIYNIEQKEQGIIIADQTGIGKGRCAAAMIRYATKQGLKPIFITEKPNLFSDLYRDLKAIGSERLKPFIVNGRESKTMVKDEEGNIVFEPLVQYLQDDIFKTRKMPIGFDYVLCTYSQISDAKGSAKISFLQSISEGNNLILDESHNASGMSNTGKTLQGMVRDSKGVTFLSATFAKRPDNMPLYAAKTCISEANLTSEGLSEAINRGGVALQEVISSQLVGQGQMVRRERTYDGIEVNYITLTENADRDKRIADNVTNILRSIIDFQTNYVLPEIKVMDKIAKGNQSEMIARQGTEKAGVDASPYFSKIFQVVNQMLFAIKAEAVADRAIMRLKEGKKPVIAFSSTMGSFLESLEDEYGQPVTDGAVISADFATVLIRGLYGVLRYTEILSNGDRKAKSFDITEFEKDTQREFFDILDKINGASSGLVISPIDLIKQKIQKAGYKVAEVTGRKMEVFLEEKEISVTEFQKYISNIGNEGASGAMSPIVRTFMPEFQQIIVRESDEFGGILEHLDKQLSAIPKMGVTERKFRQQLDKPDANKNLYEHYVAQAHYFYGGSDWYIIEWDGKDMMYGYVILNGDTQNAELGNISLQEITSYRDKGGYSGIELDFHWQPITLAKLFAEKGLEGKRKRKGIGEKEFVMPTEPTTKRIFGTVMARHKENTNDAFRKFNNDEVDVLMINQSGSTGASAHAIATSKVPANRVRQRVMIVLQAELDINTEVQKRGRINRTGQLLLPIYDYITSAIPAEKRFMMMLQKKLKSLDANTSANQRNSEALMKSDDFLNKYGDKVVATYLKENPILNEALGDPLKLNENESDSGKKSKGSAPENAAHKVSGRVAVLETKAQEAFYNTILDRYRDYVAMLIEEDRYDLEVETQDLKARMLTKEFLVAGRGGVSPFGDSTFLEKCEVNVLRKPLSPSELEKALKTALNGKKASEIKDTMLLEGSRTIKKQIAQETIDIDKNYEKKLANIQKEKAYAKITSDEEKFQYIIQRKNEINESWVTSKTKMIQKYENDWDYVYKMIDFFSVGRMIDYPDDYLTAGSGSTMAICLGIKVDLKNPKPYASGNLGLRIVIASSKRSITFSSLSGENSQRILAIKGASNEREVDYSIPLLVQTWTKKIQDNNKSRDIRYILTGNLLQAHGETMPKGRLIQYSTVDGKQRKGVLLPESYNKKINETKGADLKVTVPVGKIFPLLAEISTKDSIKCNQTVVILKDNQYDYRITTSSAREQAGHIYLHEDILQYIQDENFEKVSNRMVGYCDVGNMQKVLDILQDTFGVSAEINAADFKFIEHQFEKNQFSDEVITPQKVVHRVQNSEPEEVPVITKKPFTPDRVKAMKLKYRYQLRLQIQLSQSI